MRLWRRLFPQQLLDSAAGRRNCSAGREKNPLIFYAHNLEQSGTIIVCVCYSYFFPFFFYFVVYLSRFDPRGVVANDADLLSAFDWEFLVVVCVCKC